MSSYWINAVTFTGWIFLGVGIATGITALLVLMWQSKRKYLNIIAAAISILLIIFVFVLYASVLQA